MPPAEALSKAFSDFFEIPITLTSSNNMNPKFYPYQFGGNKRLTSIPLTIIDQGDNKFIFKPAKDKTLARPTQDELIHMANEFDV